MTAAHSVRRLLARVCSAETMARVVDPTLADVRFEDGRPTWRGYLALARALTLHAVVSLPDSLSRLWSDDEHAVPRAAMTTITSALLVALPFVLTPALASLRISLGGGVSGVAPRSAQTPEMVVLLLPQALVVSLPASLLVALPLALKRRQITARLRRRIMGLAVAACVAMGALVNWGAPLAHPGFRTIVNGSPLPRIWRETAFTGFRHRLEGLRRSTTLTPEFVERARSRIEYSYQSRLALIASPVPLALLALALAATRAGRRRPVAIGLCATAGYIVASYRLHREASRFLAFVPVVAAGLFAWLPLLLIAVLAIGALRTIGPRAASES